MTPTITFTMTDRTIRRRKSAGSTWRKGDVEFEKRLYNCRLTNYHNSAFTIDLYVIKRIYPGDKHYRYLDSGFIKHPFGPGLSWDAALQFIKERIIAQLVCKRLQESAAL